MAVWYGMARRLEFLLALFWCASEFDGSMNECTEYCGMDSEATGQWKGAWRSRVIMVIVSCRSDTTPDIKYQLSVYTIRLSPLLSPMYDTLTQPHYRIPQSHRPSHPSLITLSISNSLSFLPTPQVSHLK